MQILLCWYRTEKKIQKSGQWIVGNVSNPCGNIDPIRDTSLLMFVLSTSEDAVDTEILYRLNSSDNYSSPPENIQMYETFQWRKENILSIMTVSNIYPSRQHLSLLLCDIRCFKLKKKWLQTLQTWQSFTIFSCLWFRIYYLLVHLQFLSILTSFFFISVPGLW